MIYVFASVLICIAIPLIVFFISAPNDRVTNTVAFSIFAFALLGCFIIVPLATSYCEYLNIKADYYGVVTQYKDSIEIYEDKAIINVDKISFTDLKYHGYQQEMATFIRDLRHKVTTYNSIFIKKMDLHNNLLFSWIIVPPDSGMRLLQMTKVGDNSKVIDGDKRSLNE